MTRLNDAEMRCAERHARMDDWSEGQAANAQVLLGRAIAELRDLRALLATPMPCGWDEPRVVVMRGHGAEDMVTAEWLGPKPVFHEEAAALGAGLIRAALAVKKGEG